MIFALLLPVIINWLLRVYTSLTPKLVSEVLGAELEVCLYSSSDIQIVTAVVHVLIFFSYYLAY